MTYKHMVIIPFQEDIKAFQKTCKNVQESKDIQNTILVLLFPPSFKQYELDFSDFKSIEAIKSPDILHIDSDSFDIKEIIKKFNCSDVLLLQEGERINPYMLTYIGYYYGDEENQNKSPVVLPCYDDTTTVPENSIHTLKDTLPECISGCALKADVLAKKIEKFTITTFHKIALETILEEKSWGHINTRFYKKYDAGEYTGKLIASLADEYKERNEALPQCLDNIISNYIQKRLHLPLEKVENDLAPFKEYYKQYCTIKEPDIYITKIANYFDDIEISGIVQTNKPEDKFKIVSDTKIVTLITQSEGNSFVDSLNPKMNFTARLKLSENKTEISFFSGRKQIKNIEKSDNNGNYQLFQKEETLVIMKIAPRESYKVSVIIPIYNCEKYINDTVKSVINQKLDFFTNIQIILIDDGSVDTSPDICSEISKKYPYNVNYISAHHKGVSAARNLGLKRAMGEYVFFLDADDYIDKELLQTGVEYLDTNEHIDTIAFPLQLFGDIAENETPSLNFRFEKQDVIDLNKKHLYIQRSACGALLRRKALKNIQFNEKLKYSEDAEFMHHHLLQKMQYAVMEKPYYYYRKDNAVNSATSGIYRDVNWYENIGYFTDQLCSFSEKITGIVTNFTQSMIVHELLYTMTKNELPSCLSRETVIFNIAEMLKKVDDNIIIQTKTLPYWYRVFLLKVKYNFKIVTEESNNKVNFVIGDYYLDVSLKLKITGIQEQNKALKIYGIIDLPDYSYITLKAVCGDKNYPAKLYTNENPLYFLGEVAHETKAFQIEIEQPDSDIKFFLKLGNKDIQISLCVEEDVLEKGNSIKYIGKSYLVTCQDMSLKVERAIYENIKEYVENYLKRLNIKDNTKESTVIQNYFDIYPLYADSRIWLIMDSSQASGFNKDFYDYCNEQQDDIIKYYVINENSLDGLTMEKEGIQILHHGSETHMLLYLFAEKIITADISKNQYNPYEGTELINLAQKFIHQEIIYIPNDIITDITLLKEKLPMNMKITISTEREMELLTESLRRQACITGIPKYDRLIENSGQRILFMPSWRKSLYRDEKTKNLNFSSSEYCKNINELLCHERLMETIESCGYIFYFVPHQKVILQNDDFEMDEIVQVLPSSRLSMEKIQNCSMLITDFMPTHDFIWMKKPAISYRFTEEWDDVAEKYLFSDTANSLEELVNIIIGYIESNNALAEENRKRYVEYFKHSDRRNKERIYKALCGQITEQSTF